MCNVLALFLVFIVTPIVELFLLFRIGKWAGAAPTLAFVIMMGIAGAALAKQQGRRVIEQWQSAMAQGRVPEEGVISGLLVLFGGLLMITPGVITDVLGLLLLVPVIRKPFAQALGNYFQHQLATGKMHVSVAGMNAHRPPPTEVGRVRYRPGDVIDTEGEDVE